PGHCHGLSIWSVNAALVAMIGSAYRPCRAFVADEGANSGNRSFFRPGHVIFEEFPSGADRPRTAGAARGETQIPRRQERAAGRAQERRRRSESRDNSAERDG